MPGSSNTSFIPKRNPSAGDRRSSRRQVYIGTFVVQILFIASLLATAGVFVYDYRLNQALNVEINTLDQAIVTFNEAEMQRVQAADLRLSQANTRLAHTASVTSLLEAIEASVVDSVQLTELTVDRMSDDEFEVDAQIKTTSFDSVMFQRDILEQSRTLAFSEVSNLVLQNVPPDNGAFTAEFETQGNEEFSVSFQATLSVGQASIPHMIAPISGTEADQVTETGDSMTTDIPPGLEAAEDFVDQPETTNQEQI